MIIDEEMFKQIPLRCCKDYVCDCCLNNDEVVDKYFNKELKRNLYERKVILLGNAEAGKSTFLKQMKFIHGRGFKLEEKYRMIPFMYRQIISIIRCICRAMDLLCIPFAISQNEEYARICSSQTTDDVEDYISTFSSRMVEAIKRFWVDEGVKLCYQRRREYQLTDSAEYFLNDIDRILGKDYIPTDNDILRVRVPTMTIVQEDFQISGIHLQVIDVGGQKTERRKWIHCFDNVTSIIFLASLIEYDQHIVGDPSKQNLMEESLALFRVILSSDYFYDVSVILFLNKTDLFPERLASEPLRCTYPEFDGADDDVDAAKEFIKNKYLNFAIFEEKKEKYYISPHFTCSIDSKNLKIIYKKVKDQIFFDNLDGFSPY